MFPTAIQFSHALKKHNHVVSSTSKQIVDNTGFNCAIFHHQINYNNVDFSLNFSITENHIFKENIVAKPITNYFLKLHFSTSRAPPFTA